jgi:hypothetical protein
LLGAISNQHSAISIQQHQQLAISNWQLAKAEEFGKWVIW